MEQKNRGLGNYVLQQLRARESTIPDEFDGSFLFNPSG
jgi:hypothetical protein